jgi:hypothetical protein
VPKISRLLNADEIWIWNGAKCMKLDSAVHEFLLTAATSDRPVRELLRHEDEITAERLLEYLRRMKATGLVNLERGDQTSTKTFLPSPPDVTACCWFLKA